MGVFNSLFGSLLAVFRRVFIDSNLFPFGTDSVGMQILGVVVSLITISTLFMLTKESKKIKKVLAIVGVVVLAAVLIFNVLPMVPGFVIGIAKGLLGWWFIPVAIIVCIGGVMAVLKGGLIPKLMEYLGKAWDFGAKLFGITKDQVQKVAGMDEGDEKLNAIFWALAAFAILALNGFIHSQSSEENSHAPSIIYLVVCLAYLLRWCWKLIHGALPPRNGEDPESERKVAEIMVNDYGLPEGFWLLLKRRFSKKSATWKCECGTKNPLDRNTCRECDTAHAQKGWKCKKCKKENWSTDEKCDCGALNPHPKGLPPHKHRRGVVIDDDSDEDDGSDADGIICWNCFDKVLVNEVVCGCGVDPRVDDSLVQLMSY